MVRGDVCGRDRCRRGRHRTHQCAPQPTIPPPLATAPPLPQPYLRAAASHCATADAPQPHLRVTTSHCATTAAPQPHLLDAASHRGHILAA